MQIQEQQPPYYLVDTSIYIKVLEGNKFFEDDTKHITKCFIFDLKYFLSKRAAICKYIRAFKMLRKNVIYGYSLLLRFEYK